MRPLRTILVMIALASVTAIAHAQDPEYLKRADLTFGAPVRLPGMTLPAGTYRFELANPDSERRVVRVTSQDGKKQYGFLLSVPDTLATRPEHDQPLIFFREARADVPQPVRAWFYPNESTGYEFVYPKDEAMAIARETHQRVRSMDKLSDKDQNDLRGAKVGFTDEHGDASEQPTATSGTTKPDDTGKKK